MMNSEALPESITGNESTNDSTSPLAALINFYKAFNTRDLSLMENNWLIDNTPAMSNPLGDIKRGWSEIRDVYQKIFHGPATVSVVYYDYQIHRHGKMFCAVGREHGLLKISDTELKLAIRTSRIYQQSNGQWKQLHHHGSIDDPDLLQQYQSSILNLRGNQNDQ